MPDTEPDKVPELPAPYVVPADIDVRFVLAGVEIVGSTVFSEGDFAPLYEPLLATEIDASKIQGITKKITDKYRDDGYFLATAVAEEQDLALGILRVRIYEGEITKVSFPGAKNDRLEIYREYADKITAVKPARLDNLERYLLLLDDLPGVVVDGSVKPVDKDKGLFELVLAISRQVLEGYASLDNRGTRSVGAYQLLLHGDINAGPTKREQTGLTLFSIPRSPKELVYGELTHQHHIGTEGLKVDLAISHSLADVGGIYSQTDLNSAGSRVVLGTSYPLIRSRDQNLEISAKIDVSIQRQNDDDVRTYDDRLRVLRFSGAYDLADDFDGQSTVALEYSQGLDVFGASDGQYPGQSRSKSLSDGDVSFSKIRLDASRRQKVTDLWAVQLAVAGQKTDGPLLSGEEFYLGGSQFGRAFDSGEVSGDDGAAASFEIQFGQFISKPYLDSYQIYGFYDAGVVWEIEEDHFSDGAPLVSAGGGVRLGFTKSIFGGLEVAKPINKNVVNEGDKGPRVFFYLLMNN